MKKTITYILLIIVTVLSLGLTTAYAQDRTFTPPIIPKPETLPGAADANTRTTLIENILPNFAVATIGLVSMAALVFLIIAGVRFATAYGNEEKIESAKKQVIYSLIGLVIGILSYTIVSIITNLQFEGNTSPPPATPPATTTP